MELAKAYVQIIPSAEGIKGGLEKAIGGEAASAGSSAGSLLGGNLVSTLKKVIVAAGIGKFIQSTLDAGGALQQSFGGLDTIYGEASEAAKKYAKDAAAAGISMNDYAEQAVSFGASLKMAFEGDTAKAVEAANTAIMDMTDNAAKMGTPLESIQNAYQGFAKQNYTMLDNLKLGYGGTKKEMERLLEDATKLSGVEYDIDNLGDVYEAIHVIQGELGLTGVAADEAATTFTGSMGAMKAAWENFKGELTTGGDITSSLNTLFGNVEVFIKNNMIPMITTLFKSLPDALKQAVEFGVRSLNQITSSLPDIINTGIEIVGGIVNGILSAIPYLAEAAWNLINALADYLLSGDWISIAQNIIKEFSNNMNVAAGEIFGTDSGIIEALKDGIVNGIPKLIEKALTIIEKFTAFIADHAGDIVETGIGIIKALVQGLINAFPTIIATVPKIIINITRVINENMPKILKVGLDIIVMLAKGIINNIPVIKANMGNIVKAIIGVVEAINWLNLGSKLITLFGNGIKALLHFPIDFIKSLVQSFIETITGGGWSSLGSNIIHGIAEGILNAAGAVIEAAKSVAGNIFGAVASFFQIGSPSKLMADKIGEMIPAGIAEGIEDNMKPLRNAMADVASEATASYNTDVALASRSTAAAQTSAINYGGVTINVQADSIQQSREFVDWLENQLAQRTQNRRTAALA